MYNYFERSILTLFARLKAYRKQAAIHNQLHDDALGGYSIPNVMVVVNGEKQRLYT
jgi:hypothetical protein